MQAAPDAAHPDGAPHDHAARAEERQRAYVSHHMGEAAMRARLQSFMAADETAQPAADATPAAAGLVDRVSGTARQKAGGGRAAWSAVVWAPGAGAAWADI